MLPRFKSSLSVAFILLPVCFYLLYSWYFSISVFFSDDYHLLKTILWVREEPSLLGKLKLFIQQHNEHRIVVPRLITYLNRLVFGHIDWKVLILLGNVLWASVLWFFYKGFRSGNAPVWLFIPVPFILLHPQYYDNVTWAISILQQSVIVFWFVLLSYLCARGRYAQALLVCVVATFTHGNGIFSFLIGISVLVYDRQWKWAKIWGLTWVLTGVVYFLNFYKGQNADFARSLSDPGRLLGSFFAFFGSLSKIRFAEPYAAVVIGIVFFFIMAAYILSRLFQAYKSKAPLNWSDKMLAAIMIFLAITAALVSVSRSWGGIETIIAPRYQHYSSFIACLVYLCLVSVLTGRLQKAVGIAGIVVGVLFNLLCYFTYTEELLYRRDSLLADDTNWVHHQNFLIYGASFNDNIRSEYQRAVRKGICISKDHFSRIKPDTLQNGDVELTYKQAVREEKDASRTYSRNYVAMSNRDIRDENVFIYLKSKDKKDGYWLAGKKNHSGIIDFLKTGAWFKPGFTLEFLTENISPGYYNIAILRNNRLTWTKTAITIAAPANVQ